MSEKPENRKTITIKINGKDRPFQNKDSDKTIGRKQSSVFHKEQPSETKENSLFSEESAAGKEEALEESFDWILPNPEEVSAEKNKEDGMFSFQSPRKKKDKPTHLKKENTKDGKKKSLPKEIVASIFFAVFFAVILGTSFGVILLNMVNSDQTHSTNGNIAASTTSPSSNKDNGQAAPAATSAKKQDITSYVLQGGVFSDEARAKNGQNKFLEAGTKSKIISLEGKQFLLLGVASNLEDAKAWQKKVKDTYAKEMTFKGGQVEKITIEEKNIIEESPAIYYSILQIVTTIQFKHSINGEDKKQLEEELEKVEEEKISILENKRVQKMATYLAKGGDLASKLAENSSEKEIEAVQQQLLAYLAEYVAL